MINNKLILSIFLATTLCLTAPSVLADSGTYGQYGQYGQYGPPVTSPNLLINKKVGKVTGATTKGGTASVTYVDNLSPSDTRFKPGAEVMFQITVKNTSSVTLSSVSVKDVAPSYVEPMEGPGTFDASTRTVTWDAGSFQPGEEKIYYMKMQLFGQNQLPADKGLFCLTNQAQATSGSATSSDTAQFCVEKEVIGVTQAPAAGPEAGVLLLGAQTIAMGIGFSLKRLASKK